jgi:superfamily II DNA helicase RecQ
MWDYAKSAGCRRAWWLRHFGDRTPLPAIDGCCDRCDPAGEPTIVIATTASRPKPTSTATASAVPALQEGDRAATVLRLVEAVGGAYGRKGVATILRGRLPKTGDAALAALPQFGALAKLREADVYTLIDSLVLAGFLDKDATVRPRLRLTASGRAYLAGRPAPREEREAQAAVSNRLEELAALVRAPAAEGVPSLLAALDDPNERFRQLAVVGIRRIALRPDVPPATRRAARAALGRTGGRGRMVS